MCSRLRQGFLFSSHVCAVTVPRPGRPRLRGSIPDAGIRFSFSKRPDRLWGSPTLLFSGYRRDLCPKVRKSEAYS